MNVSVTSSSAALPPYSGLLFLRLCGERLRFSGRDRLPEGWARDGERERERLRFQDELRERRLCRLSGEWDRRPGERLRLLLRLWKFDLDAVVAAGSLFRK